MHERVPEAEKSSLLSVSTGVTQHIRDSGADWCKK